MPCVFEGGGAGGGVMSDWEVDTLDTTGVGVDTRVLVVVVTPRRAFLRDLRKSCLSFSELPGTET